MDIFVGSLPFKIKEAELKAIFEQFGTVESVSFVIDKITRQNKGYGFVVMPDEQEALKAIDALHGTELMERTIKVEKSGTDKKTDRKGFKGGNANGRNFLRNNNKGNRSGF